MEPWADRYAAMAEYYPFSPLLIGTVNETGVDDRYNGVAVGFQSLTHRDGQWNRPQWSPARRTVEGLSVPYSSGRSMERG